MLQMRQNVTGKKVAFSGMGIPGQDKRLNPFCLIRPYFGEHLVRVTDNRRTAA